MGRIPIFIYNDIAWIPYQGTNLSIENFGFLAGLTIHENTLPIVIKDAYSLSDKDFQKKLQYLHDVRYHYTYSGVINQINMFLRDPFGEKGGDLRCVPHPKDDRFEKAAVNFQKEDVIYLVKDGLKHPIAVKTLKNVGMSKKDVVLVTDRSVMDMFPTGPAMH